MNLTVSQEIALLEELASREAQATALHAIHTNRYRRNHPEKARQYKQNWVNNNRKRVRKYNNDYYHKNKDAISKRRKILYQKKKQQMAN